MPLQVRPFGDEALVSWLARLAQRFGLTTAGLVREGFAVCAVLTPDWWGRPDNLWLQTFASRSGIPTDRLRSMTLLDCSPAVRDDEAAGRFNGFRFQQVPPAYRERGLAVCPQCFKEDSEAYVRKIWLIGWVAVCPVHDCALLTQCPRCRASLRVPRSKTKAFDSARYCRTCWLDLASERIQACPADAARLQAAFLAGKHAGNAWIPGIGRITWSELVDVCDTLLGAIWCDMTFAERAVVLGDFYCSIPPCSTSIDCTRSRLGALLLLNWLFMNWENTPATAVILKRAAHWLAQAAERPRDLGPTPEEVERSHVLRQLRASARS
jgi:TniQ